VGVVERIDGTLRLLPHAETRIPHIPEMAALSLPLRVRDRTVGVLRVARAEGLALDAGERRFFSALAYYAALGAERVRLTAEAQHAEALREADRLKDAVLAAVSHDLRTPLTTIKALAHEIGAGGDARAAGIEEEADRLNRFVGDLLDLSRLNAGALELNPEIVAAEDLVGAALQRASGCLGAREIVVSVGPGDSVLLGRFDFVHALRVLVNLLENAHKYSPPGTPVELSAAREDARLVFRIADRGPGIAETERGRVFEPFYRGPGRQPDTGGAGLGLSIASGLAEAQGGHVRYEPRAGGGSIFVFSLPAADDRPARDSL
jgi:two-component system sensor histidine kinase KdpD